MPLYRPRMKKRTALLYQLKVVFRSLKSQPISRVIYQINPKLLRRLITLEEKCAGARSAGNPHAACDAAGAGNGITAHPTRARRGKPSTQPRSCLRIAAPVPDPSAAMLAAVLAGESPADGSCPAAIVVILGDGKGDRLVGSPGVNVSVGWESIPVRSAREASKSTGRSKSEPM